MKFGEVPIGDALGAVLAHSTRVSGSVFKKGRRLGKEDIVQLRDAGHSSVVAARLEPDDVDEDSAARVVAEALTGEGVRAAAPFTGRANLYALADGVVVLDAARIEAFNRVHESLTVATVVPFQLVREGQMLATIKVIPFAVERSLLDRAVAELTAGQTAALSVAPLRPKRAGVIQTRLDGTRESVLDKTSRLLASRLHGLRSEVVEDVRCAHRAEAIAQTVRSMHSLDVDLILIVGASAIVDRCDEIPAGVERAGGRVIHFGMPVDPGNLLLRAELDGVPVLGLPGCARSPKYNGLDRVLERLVADLRVGAAEIMGMGVGGLLKEMPDRPQPRRGQAKPPAAPAQPPKLEALVLAAGQSRRMGRVNKMTVELDGRPMVAYAVEELIGARIHPRVVVGHEAGAVREALSGRAVTFVESPDYGNGLSASLRAGIESLDADTAGVLVCLGDMPLVRAAHIERLVSAFDPGEGRSICVPTFDGKRGNPVLFSREFFGEIASIQGDVGARHLIGEHEDSVCEVAMADRAVLVDIDSPRALSELLGDGEPTP